MECTKSGVWDIILNCMLEASYKVTMAVNYKQRESTYTPVLFENWIVENFIAANTYQMS